MNYYRDTYFRINDCKEEELDELREKLFWADGDELEAFSEDERKIIESCETPEEIPYYLLEEAFCEYVFVDEDFWCNC